MTSKYQNQVNHLIHKVYDLDDAEVTPNSKMQEAWYKLGYEDGIEIGKEEMMIRIANRLLETLDDETLSEKLGVPLELVAHIREGNFDVFKD
ncbi:MAG TPA: hypothetical protein DCY20_02635 [Firmicutes bacterium]|nr:hypothetical protein [Bacillota bacterium]